MPTVTLPDLLELAPRERPFTVEEYHALARAGVLTEDDRVELLDGRIITMSPIGSRHLHCVNRLTRLFSTRIYGEEGPRAILSVQNPVRLGTHDEPEPDVVLLRPDAPQDRTPRPDDVLLIVEVADTTLDYDRRIKHPRYAAAGISEYWIVDVNDGTVTVHRRPSADGYAEVVRHARGDDVSVQALPGVPPLAVQDIVEA